MDKRNVRSRKQRYAIAQRVVFFYILETVQDGDILTMERY